MVGPLRVQPQGFSRNYTFPLGRQYLYTVLWQHHRSSAVANTNCGGRAGRIGAPQQDEGGWPENPASGPPQWQEPLLCHQLLEPGGEPTRREWGGAKAAGSNSGPDPVFL